MERPLGGSEEKGDVSVRRYRFKFFDGQVFIGEGKTVRDALVRLGLGAYNPVAYEVTDITDATSASQ